MVQQKVTVQHNFRLSIDEEQHFVNAVLKKYSYTHGNVNLAIREAIIDWINKIEREK